MIDLKKIARENWYVLLCFTVFASLFYIYAGNVFDHRLDYNYPFPYFAADQFSQMATAQAALDQGNYYSMPAYMDWGLNESLPHYGPGMVHLAIFGTLSTGVPIFSSIMLIYAILFLIMGFLFIESLHFSKEMKILSLCLMPLLIVFNFVIASLWGQYGSLAGTFFLFLLFFIMSNKEFRNPVYIGLAFTFITISHFSDVVFAVFFMIAVVVYEIIKKKEFTLKKIWDDNRKYLLAALIFLVVSAYYLAIFYYGDYHSIIQSNSWNFKVSQPADFNGFRVPLFGDFKFLAVLIGIGLLLLLLSKSEDKLLLLFIIFITNLNYFTFFPQADFRAFQARFYWPITLAPLLALAVYFIIDKIGELKKNIKASVFIAFLIIFIIAFSQYKEIKGPGILSEDQYNAMRFLEQNVSDGSKIAVLYGDGYDPAVLAFKKADYMPSKDFMIKEIQQKKIGAQDEFSAIPHSVGGLTTVFDNGKITFVPLPAPQNYTICDFDYYLLDKFSRYNSPLIAFNQIFLSEIDQNKFQIIYENQQAGILKRTGDSKCLKN